MWLHLKFGEAKMIGHVVPCSWWFNLSFAKLFSLQLLYLLSVRSYIGLLYRNFWYSLNYFCNDFHVIKVLNYFFAQYTQEPYIADDHYRPFNTSFFLIPILGTQQINFHFRNIPSLMKIKLRIQSISKNKQ